MSGKGRRFLDFADAIEHDAGAIPGQQNWLTDERLAELLRSLEAGRQECQDADGHPNYAKQCGWLRTELAGLVGDLAGPAAEAKVRSILGLQPAAS